jgi:hypothetical protein
MPLVKPEGILRVLFFYYNLDHQPQPLSHDQVAIYRFACTTGID